MNRRATDSAWHKAKTVLTIALSAMLLIGGVVAALSVQFETKEDAHAKCDNMTERIVEAEKDIVKIEVKLDAILEGVSEIKEAVYDLP